MKTHDWPKALDTRIQQALREAAEAFAVASVTDDEGAVRATSKWLDARADRIERGEHA